MSVSDGKSVDVSRFIEGMRHVPSVVTVVTTGNDDGIWGITIGSFVSLSIDPPLICFNVQKTAAIHDPIVNSEQYIVHVLRENQIDLSDHFARSDISKEEHFVDLDYSITGSGAPLLEDALVTFICHSYDVLPGGDHSILVGRVAEVRHGSPGRPAVYHQRAYFGIGPYIADHE